jgi:putative acetyltransferase
MAAKGGYNKMKIWTERINDYDEMFKLNYLAYRNREDEFRLVERIRSSERLKSQSCFI